MTTLTGIHLAMPELEYHARPELSSTEARLILETPARYRWKKDHPPLVAASKKFDIGSAVHSKVLGTGYEAVMIPDDLLASNGAISTTAAKEFVEHVRAEGKIPLKRADFEPIDHAAESVLAHAGARAVFNQPGAGEVSVFATDPTTGVAVRARFDFLPPTAGLGSPSRIAADLKTTIDASPKGFTKAIASYGYDVQHAWYTDTLRFDSGEDAEMVFVAVEKTEPYLVGVYQLPTIWKEMGRTKAAHARRTYAECMESGVWPGYGDEVHLLSPPTWLIYEHEEKYA
jgi:hypothetical protein